MRRVDLLRARSQLRLRWEWKELHKQKSKISAMHLTMPFTVIFIEIHEATKRSGYVPQERMLENVLKAASMSGKDRDSFLVLNRRTAALPWPNRRVRMTRERQAKETITSFWFVILLRKPDSPTTEGMLTAN